MTTTSHKKDVWEIDRYGIIRVIDKMGGDESVVQAARVSYGKGTKSVREDRGLIRYLMRHHHTTPFEMCEIKLHVKVPMDTWRQWIRHRTASVNEYSTRYSIAIDDKKANSPKEWRLQSEKNRQGSAGFLEERTGKYLTDREAELHQFAHDIYSERLEKGVAREQARKDLPLSTYTEAYWKIDLHNLLHFLQLRMDQHAQIEIREYANIIGYQIVKEWVPLTWEAFVDYRLNSVSISGIEKEVIKRLNSEPVDSVKYLEEKGLIEYGKTGMKRNRERQELEDKLVALGYSLPWLDQ